MKNTVSLLMIIFALLMITILTGASDNETIGNFKFENQQNYKIVSGVIRNTGSGWEIISDSYHEPIHVKSVSNTNQFITIEHTFKAQKVVSFIVTPDETFIEDGINVGASVGLDKSILYVNQNGTYLDPSKVVSSKGNFWFYGIFIVD